MPEFSRVSIVVDPGFGSKLGQLVKLGAVWIIDTPNNQDAIRDHWANHPQESHVTGVTSFSANGTRSAEEALLGEIDAVDLHHGEYSSDLPYRILNVVGTELTPRVESVLREYGFSAFERTDQGFTALR